MSRLESAANSIRDVPFAAGGCAAMVVAIFVGPVLTIPFWIAAGKRIEHFQGSIVAYAMLGACVGLALFFVLKAIAALLATRPDPERIGRGARFLRAIGNLVFVVLAVSGALFLAAITELRHPHDSPDYVYTDHVWESLEARRRFVERRFRIPSRPTSLRYRIARYDDSDGSGMNAEFVATVAKVDLPRWTRGCSPIPRPGDSSTPRPPALHRPSPNATYFDCTSVDRADWTVRIVDAPANTVVVVATSWH